MLEAIDYYVMNPTGNITILVTTPVEELKQPEVALALMAQEPRVEQVGYVTFEPKGCDIALRMAGGEFCGNATLCTAALFMLRKDLTEKRGILVKVSGVEAPVTVHMEGKEGPGQEVTYHGTVAMPRVASVEELDDFPGMKVDLGGILHVVTQETLPDQEAEAQVKKWARDWQAEAVGLMQVDLAHDRLRPLVYVDTASTLFWENSCASGSSAVGAAMAYSQQKEVLLKLSQPGGTLAVDASPDGAIYLTGSVEIEEYKSFKC